MATTRKKQGKRRAQPRGRRAARKGASLGYAALSLAVVALALGGLLGGLWLRDRAAGTRVEAPVAPGAGGEVPAQAPAAVAAPHPVADPAPAGEAAAIVPENPAKPGSGPAAAAKSLQPASYKPRFKPLPPPKPRYLVFIIDDAGYSLKQLEAFLRLPFPLTIAVLPGLPNSEKAAIAVRAAGKELILHQPMQALGGQDPGPGAILLGMGRAEVESLVEANLLTVPGAIGMNNHMGSAATTDLGLMEAVAEVAKRRGIYYLDSLTTSGTAVQTAARREGIHYWERDVFLDNAPDRASIIRAVEEGKKHASKARPAVMIGHVWSAELAQTLTDLYPQLVAEGFSLSTISRFMVEEAAEDDASPGD